MGPLIGADDDLEPALVADEGPERVPVYAGPPERRLGVRDYLMLAGLAVFAGSWVLGGQGSRPIATGFAVIPGWVSIGALFLALGLFMAAGILAIVDWFRQRPG